VRAGDGLDVAGYVGQSRPLELGESGSPSMSVILPSFTPTGCPHPTAQYGQIDFPSRAPSAWMRGVSSMLRLENEVAP